MGLGSSSWGQAGLNVLRNDGVWSHEEQLSLRRVDEVCRCCDASQSPFFGLRQGRQQQLSQVTEDVEEEAIKSLLLWLYGFL